MTVNETTSNELALDKLFDTTRPMAVALGYKVEIVEGAVHMRPVRKGHRQISSDIVQQLRPRYPKESDGSTGCIYLPGHQNGFAPSVLAIKDGGVLDPSGRWRYQDIDLVAEVTPEATAANIHGYYPKKTAYATAEVPVYLIVDPHLGKCRAYTQPEEGDYLSEVTVAFGTDIDPTCTPVGLTLTTGEFPRD